jgi:alkylation response protein AidB-like acyl-CoA dehydrogenase
VDFTWTDDQRALRDAVIGLAHRALNNDVANADADQRFPRAAWDACAQFGIQGLSVPGEYGGGGADALTTIAALEGLGYGCTDNGLIFSLNAQMWAVQYPIARYGTDDQKQRYLPGLCSGTLIGGHAMSEPGSGSDAFALATTAVEDGDGWRLNGSKTFVTNGPVADVFVVFATTDRTKGFAGLCAFLVERTAPGLGLGAPLRKMGLRTSPMSEVFLDDCFVSRENLLGKRNGGMAIFASAMERERSLILASTVGTMERELEQTVEYARTRRQFGQPIGKFQAVSHRLVEMKLRLESARLLLYRLGWLIDHGLPTALDSALVKLHLSESLVSSSLDALQVHGGYGYMADYEIERHVRDAIGSRLYSGTSDIQKNIAARAMGL